MAKKKTRKQTTPTKQPKTQQWLVTGTIAGIIILFAVVFVWPSSSTNRNNTRASIQNVSVNDLANATGDHFVIDVREQWEYDQGHVPGVTLIPLGELESRVSELPSDKPIYVICQSGNRSVTASNILKQAGVADIRNVQGGTLAWQQAGLPIEQ